MAWKLVSISSALASAFRPREVEIDRNRRVSHKKPVGRENLLKCESTVLWGFVCLLQTVLYTTEACFVDDSFPGACSLIL